jgi:periplasmic protein TonB
MFSTLESNWDQSAHRGWTTLASFTMQAIGLSLLLAVSLIWVERPPQVHWLQPVISRAGEPRVTPQAVSGHHTDPAVAKPRADQIIAPTVVPQNIANVNDAKSDADTAPSAPDLAGFRSGRSGPGGGVDGGTGDMLVAIPPRPVVTKPLLVSHWAEGNLVYRVQPTYPAIARQARVQGSVELRAVISKTGTIENLIVVSGHPMLSSAAIAAVRQWRYRPYLLNNEAVEVETEITVNFLLSGG